MPTSFTLLDLAGYPNWTLYRSIYCLLCALPVKSLAAHSLVPFGFGLTWYGARHFLNSATPLVISRFWRGENTTPTLLMSIYIMSGLACLPLVLCSFLLPAGPGADASTHNAAPQSPTPRGFADWSASSSASLAAQATSNAFHYSLSPCYAFWTHYMLNKNAYCSYPPPPRQEHAHPLCHNDNRAKYPGPASSFGFESFTTTSLAPNICAHMPPIGGPISAKETETSEDLPRVVRSSDEMGTRNGGELHCETVSALPELKQGHESCAAKLNSGQYQVILRKELTKSDVGNVGRIVLPKKDAEASLPPLFQRDPMILQMDDMVLPVTWKFKYRYWPNNKSRMYILDATGTFVKTHGLQAGDALIIYKNSEPGKFIIQGEKAIQLTANPQMHLDVIATVSVKSFEAKNVGLP